VEQDALAAHQHVAEGPKHGVLSEWNVDSPGRTSQVSMKILGEHLKALELSSESHRHEPAHRRVLRLSIDAWTQLHSHRPMLPDSMMVAKGRASSDEELWAGRCGGAPPRKVAIDPEPGSIAGPAAQLQVEAGQQQETTVHLGCDVRSEQA
jgi:hypothetical protein